ncbi:MAG: type 4a pilus biogenesis protein PilO [Deltaproteobacteria bacterium]|nr:type 4a pilus biogenesis protein PilO [Deltaproteobacteria bacterium]MBW2594417.1 type 4a pilus biogenesis protein PilO [Deltaproteobacteria bacterium]MBW2649737.1 type 4a pilus biogenesis protein PilO [Deltaproteobacteria bacterium]
MAIGLDDIKKLSTGKKLLIGLGLFLLLGYFYWFYLFQPAFEKKVKLGEDLENINRQIVTRQQVANKIEQHKKEIARLEEALQIILAKLPEQKEIPRLLTSVSEAGRDAGLDFVLFEPKAPVSKDFYAEIPVRITVEGKYNDIAVFFDSVANLPRIANITDVEIKKGGKDTEKDILKADCSMKIYMFLEEANEKPDEKKK